MRPSLNILSTDLIEQILAESKQILEKIGIEVRGPHLKQKLIDGGLKTDSTGTRIMFPADVVEKAIDDCPKGFKLYNRDGDVHADLSGDNVHFVPASSGLKVHDHRTDRVRLADTKDFVEYIRLCDGLEHIAYLATAFSTNDDIEAQVSDVWRLYLSLTNSKKPIVSGAFTEEGVPRMAEMMGLFRNGKQDLIDRPMSIFTITATGNFRYSEDSCQNLLDCVENGIPLEIVPVTLMGLIAPVTLVGATVFHTVDVLAGLVMAQIVRPGHPILFGGAPAAFHMKAATSPMVAIEALHLDVAYAAVADYLGIPSQGYMALSDTKQIDAQAGAETFGSALLAAMAGINSVSGPGMLDFVLTFSLPKLIIDNDFCGQALHFCREVSPAGDLPTLGIVEELMREDHLITSEHTLEHWPSHLYLPDPVIDRLNRENWEEKGEKTLIERATAEVDLRLAAYEPLQTDPLIDAEMRKIIQSGFISQEALPEVPVALKPKPEKSKKSRRRKR